VTVQSLTSSDKSARSFLDARDARQDSLARILSEAYPATIFLSLNIPGSKKAPPGSGALFNMILDDLFDAFVGLVMLEQADDLLGPYAIVALRADPAEVKKRCIALETNYPYSRLLDLDVYSISGTQIDRASLGCPPRRCLICLSPAIECIRLKRHSLDDVIARTHELLKPFSA
jgi:holo-ACP synthase